MGRPPSNGTPSFRFHPSEVAQMEAILQQHEGHVPPRELLVALAERFSHSPERAGKIVVQMKQIWNWFQNRRYALRAKLGKTTEKSTTSPITRDEVTPVRNVSHVPQHMSVSSGPHVVRYASEAPTMEFEAKSARDGAWYDVQAFLSHRYLETGNPEVLVRFTGFGMDEEEWLNIRKHVRQRSLPCEAPECIAVLPGDTVLCFQEGKEQALYFDAHVLDAQRRRHDMRGCRCRFLVCYDHDQSEEIVPLRKICRRPETDYRLQVLHATNEASSSLGMTNPNPSTAPTLDTAAPSVGLLSTNPVPMLDRAPNPSPTSVINPTSVPAPATILVTETSSPVPEQKTVENDIPAQIAVPIVPNKVETVNLSQIPVQVTEPNKIEADNPDLVLESNSSVSVPELLKVEIDNPVSVPEPEKTMEAKKAESSDRETVALTESSVSEGQISGNPIGSVPGLEKDESGIPGIGPETGSTVEMKH